MRKIDTIYLTADNIKTALANTLQVTFEVTDACNLNCEYCGYGKFYYDHDKRNNKNLSEKKAVLLLNYLEQLWQSKRYYSYNKNIYISFYGGEPLINIEFIKIIVNYIESNMMSAHHIFTFSMTTNAILLDKYIDYLVEHKFHLLISLDGDEENTIYRVDKQGKQAYNRIIKNVDFVRNKYPEYFVRFVNFNAVLHNKNSVECIYSFFKDRYNKIPSISALNNIGIRPDLKEEFHKMYINTADSLLSSEHYSELERDMFINAPTYRSAAMYLLQYSEYVYNDYNELLYGKKTLRRNIPTGTCVPFSRKIFVTVNGKILPCERIGQQFGLGWITDTEVQLDFEAIAERYNRWYAKLETQCASCKLRRSCIQCIFNLEDIDCDKVKCHGYMTQKDFDNYRNAQMSFLYRHPDAYSRIMKEVVFQ